MDYDFADVTSWDFCAAFIDKFDVHSNDRIANRYIVRRHRHFVIDKVLPNQATFRCAETVDEYAVRIKILAEMFDIGRPYSITFQAYQSDVRIRTGRRP